MTKDERLLLGFSQVVVAAAVAMTTFAVLVAGYNGRDCVGHGALFWMLVCVFSLSIVWGLAQLVRMTSLQFGTGVNLLMSLSTGAALYLLTGFAFATAYDESEWILAWIVGVLLESGVLERCH